MPFPIYESELEKLEIAVIDLETTGLLPRFDRIIQVAVVPVRGGKLIPSAWESKVNPGDIEIPPKVLELTGLDEREVRRAPRIRRVLQQFDRRVGRRVVAGHNVKRFDLRFLRRAEMRAGIDVQTDYYIDTLLLAQAMRPQLDSHRLAACADEWGIDYDADRLHDALEDTRVCARLLIALIEELRAYDVTTFGQMIQFLGRSA